MTKACTDLRFRGHDKDKDMNYVAHLFLAKPSDEHRIGSLLADFALEASFLAFFPALVDFSAALIGKSE
jgi:hypothetical protein